MSKIERLYCEQCNEWIVLIEGVMAIYDRGYWWCAKHAQVSFRDGKPYVDFPSNGKLMPDTIMHE